MPLPYSARSSHLFWTFCRNVSKVWRRDPALIASKVYILVSLKVAQIGEND